MSEFFVALQSK